MKATNTERDELQGVIIGALAVSMDYAGCPPKFEAAMDELLLAYIDNGPEDSVEVLVAALLQIIVDLGSAASGGRTAFRGKLRDWVPGYSLGGIRQGDLS
jgi:hypothetical protein